MMTRFFFSIALVLIAAGGASAQQPQKPGQDACGRDASRFCRAHLGEGDMVVLSCLQQHRAKLSKACQATLAANGR
jgi:cysteine rich repeat protein